MMRRVYCGLALAGAALCSAATSPPIPLVTRAAADTNVYVLRAGRVYDGKSDSLLPARDLLIVGDSIAAIGVGLTVPANARVIDLRRFTVLPGLIDSHAHLLMEHAGNAGPGEVGVRMLTQEGEALRALRGAARARTYIDAGFTSVRDLGNSGMFGDVALKRAIAEGSLVGPRLFVSGPGLAPVNAQMDGLDFRHRTLAEEDYRIIHGPVDARDAVRENVTAGADLIKIYSNASPNPTYLSLEEMRAITDEAHLMGVVVTAHATTDLAIRRAVDAGVDAIEHGRGAADSTLALMRQRGVRLVLTEWDSVLVRHLLQKAAGARPADAKQVIEYTAPGNARIRQALASKVEIIAGSDMYVAFDMPRGAAAKHAILAFVDAGMAPADVLRSATSRAAKLLHAPRLGVIEAGKLADIIAIDGDPLRDPRTLERVRFVMKGGVVHLAP